MSIVAYIMASYSDFKFIIAFKIFDFNEYSDHASIYFSIDTCTILVNKTSFKNETSTILQNCFGTSQKSMYF